jgi:C-terminal processing protease CtpA/Prc
MRPHAQRTLPLLLGPLLLGPLLIACGHWGKGEPEPAPPPPPVPEACPLATEQEQVLALARSWYLFPELLDPAVLPSATTYPDTKSFLAALTKPAKDAGVDKGWSFMTTAVANERYYGVGESIGFGIALLTRSPRVFLSQVLRGSPAWDAGFRRGDELLSIGETEATLEAVSVLVPAGRLTSALGPSLTEGVTRVFQVQTVAGAAAGDPPVIRTMTTRIYSLDPVAYYGVSGGVGILVLRTFVSTADAELRTAMAQFKAAGVTSVVVDLRYNAGGLASTAKLLVDLLSAGRTGTAYLFKSNANHPEADQTFLFAPPAEAIQPTKIAFITTRASASASELVANVLEPFLGGPSPAIALVGARTYGKPIGQRGWALTGCGSLLYLSSFQVLNAQGEGDYFAGLPDTAVPPQFTGTLCTAADDLNHELGDPAEGSTAAALSWLATGACPAAAPARARAGGATPPPDEHPIPADPALEQREMPGLF